MRPSIERIGSAAPMADRPMLAGSARDRKISCTVLMSQMARAPTKRSLLIARSMSATSAADSSTRSRAESLSRNEGRIVMFHPHINGTGRWSAVTLKEMLDCPLSKSRRILGAAHVGIQSCCQ